MKWFQSHCRRREDASLLAADILSGDEKIAVEHHLVECAECRAYYNELTGLVAPFVRWEKNFSSIEPSQAMRTRWAESVKQGVRTPFDSLRPSHSIAGFFGAVWRELIWPRRYVWSGLAALWAAMLVVNAQLSDHPKSTSASSPQEVLQAWKEQERVLVEWDRPGVTVQTAPAHVPSPRSERDQDWTVI